MSMEIERSQYFRQCFGVKSRKNDVKFRHKSGSNGFFSQSGKLMFLISVLSCV